MEAHHDDDDWNASLPTSVLTGCPGYPDTEVAVHKREGDKVLVSSVSWQSKHSFWVSERYVHEIHPEEAPRAPRFR